MSGSDEEGGVEEQVIQPAAPLQAPGPPGLPAPHSPPGPPEDEGVQPTPPHLPPGLPDAVAAPRNSGHRHSREVVGEIISVIFCNSGLKIYITLKYKENIH